MTSGRIESGMVAAARRFLRPTLGRPAQYAPRKLRLEKGMEGPALPANAPSVAVVTPSLNQARFIGEAIDSVLGQSYPLLAYLVMDGGSTDGTPAFLARYGDRLLWKSTTDGGQADALNRGFECIRGEIMGWLNSDDMWLPGTLARIVSYFEANPKVDLVYGNRIFIDDTSRETGRVVLPPHDPKALRYLDFVPQESLFWRRRAWDLAGPFDPAFRFAIDWDFILRAAAAGCRFARIPYFLGCFRVHTAQKTRLLAGAGRKEADLLRQRQFGRPVPEQELSRGVRRYMLRQSLWQRLHAAGLGFLGE
jgi:glycosyltransferase involved in cell wall biosynthesis